MPKPIEIPPQAAKAFARDVKAFFKAKGHEADEIAAKQAWLLKNHLPRGAKLRISDVKVIFADERSNVARESPGEPTAVYDRPPSDLAASSRNLGMPIRISSRSIET